MNLQALKNVGIGLKKYIIMLGKTLETTIEEESGMDI